VAGDGHKLNRRVSSVRDDHVPRWQVAGGDAAGREPEIDATEWQQEFYSRLGANRNEPYHQEAIPTFESFDHSLVLRFGFGD
jgi:hypothetical protein